MLHQLQPLGVLPYPTGLLLLPEDGSPAAATACAAWMEGRAADEVPNEWRFYAKALGGDVAGAMASIEGDTSPMAAYNRFVMGGAEVDFRAASSCDDPTIAEIAWLAAYVQGATERPPDGASLTGELRANVMLAHAAWHMEREDAPAVIAALREGITAARGTSPLLAAQLSSQLAQVLAPNDHQGSIVAWRDAVQLSHHLTTSPLRAELCLGYALALHESAEGNRMRLVEAVKWYQEALHAGFSRESAPTTFALIQNNLGLAYAAMPMTDSGERLRLGVAVQAFREALKVYTRDEHAEQWASTMLNLANSLQYLPSSHTKENLIEAVNVYEELMTVRTRAMDPLGYARLLANQGTALSHLGMFAPALEKLNEAHKLLHWHGEGEAAALLLEQVERVNEQMSTVESVASPAEGMEE